MIGERLQELRKDKKMSQEALAEILGVSHYTVSSYECNRSNPDDNAKIKIAKLFNVSIDYLLGLTDEPVSFAPKANTIVLPESFNETDINKIKEYSRFISFEKKHREAEKNRELL